NHTKQAEKTGGEQHGFPGPRRRFQVEAGKRLQRTTSLLQIGKDQFITTSSIRCIAPKAPGIGQTTGWLLSG
ncbi:MAG TPA: hypothetical protein PKV86_14675, partial [Syntrophobacteraceae bacterium]|nr:hypothetical protein [Syntrophobacteraceae bacterium]